MTIKEFDAIKVGDRVIAYDKWLQEKLKKEGRCFDLSYMQPYVCVEIQTDGTKVFQELFTENEYKKYANVHKKPLTYFSQQVLQEWEIRGKAL